VQPLKFLKGQECGGCVAPQALLIGAPVQEVTLPPKVGFHPCDATGTCR
jgi:hypothetical protein